MLALRTPDGARLLWFGGRNLFVRADDPAARERCEAQVRQILADTADDAGVETQLRSMRSAQVIVDTVQLRQELR